MKDNLVNESGGLVNDCISRQAAIDAINAVFPVDPMKSEYAQGIACGAALAKTYVEQLPSAQPQRMKGKWIDVTKTGGAELWKCSECGELELEDSYFCPNCGADMRGEQDG